MTRSICVGHSTTGTLRRSPQVQKTEGSPPAGVKETTTVQSEESTLGNHTFLSPTATWNQGDLIR